MSTLNLRCSFFRGSAASTTVTPILPACTAPLLPRACDGDCTCVDTASAGACSICMLST
eukprot:CAMPEP_0173213688 /NCGR_PEP_ID=MMETSP1141-20130122/25545_1 /TAXON_ID=483371 /ORGANISM="non described non described, Strain CCMP2298" /LENGTH=58 /DNA_ID=CAMNT_0014140947 /DNA_START=131 /DNA_END=307 /DNA_ORIENTATION=+